MTVFILANDEVSASVAIFSTLDGAPDVGTVNLLALLRVGLVSGSVEIIYMATHGSNDERSALLVFLTLRKPLSKVREMPPRRLKVAWRSCQSPRGAVVEPYAFFRMRRMPSGPTPIGLLEALRFRRSKVSYPPRFSGSARMPWQGQVLQVPNRAGRS